MSISKLNTEVLQTIVKIPVKMPLELPRSIINFIKNEKSSNYSSIDLSTYHTKTNFCHKIVNCISIQTLRLSVIFALLAGILACFKIFLPVAATGAPCSLAITMIIRVIMAVKNIHKLNISKKECVKILKHIDQEKTSKKNISQPAKHALLQTKKIINSQKRFHKLSIAAASITLMAVIGLTVAVGLILASIYGGSCIGLTPVVNGLSITHLLLITSGSVLGLGLLFNVSIAIKSFICSWKKKDTCSQLQATVLGFLKEVKI